MCSVYINTNIDNAKSIVLSMDSLSVHNEPPSIERRAQELYKCVKTDQLVKAKFYLKGLPRETKKKIVSHTFDGNAPLFLAAQQGQLHFVNYLLEECYADIEQKGVYEVAEDRSKHQVTPLWCSSVANKIEVVKSLLNHGADVNAISDTNSTPVRSACYMTNIEVVKILVEHGADIHKPNINGGTCLINSVQSAELCKFLIENGASTNAQDNSGNLALHYAIREGRLETVKLLLNENSDPYVKNDFGDDSIQTASLRGYADILEHLLHHVYPSVVRQIEAYELLGTNYVDEKHDISQALTAWRKAMELRYQDPENVVVKQISETNNAAYMNISEVTNCKELEHIATNPDAVYMQALLIRERILGPDHKDTVFGLMFRGAVYADAHRYQRCVDLWKYAFQLRHDKQEPFNHECIFTLQALCKLFWEIHEEFEANLTNQNVCFNDVCEVLDMAVDEVYKKNSFKTEEENDSKNLFLFEHLPLSGEEPHVMLLLILHLIHLMCKIITTSEQERHLCITVHKLIVSGVKGNNGKSLLHLATDNKISTIQDEVYSRFPSVEVVKLLIRCGCDVNSRDNDKNTTLHVCADGFDQLLTQRKYTDILGEIVMLLLNNDAHVDCVNSKGIDAGKLLHRRIPNVFVNDYVSLKCLAAKVIQKHSIPFEGEIPVTLIPFVKLH